jgi:outer membrane lipopolysaccharide assembly protein LptE/RlpB
MRIAWLAAASVPMLMAAGCGYHVAGRADLLPQNIKTIAVPAFSNATSRYYQLARQLPEDITREFISRTRYRIVADAAQADAVLSGGVVNAFAYPTTLDQASGRATAVQIGVTLSLTFTDRATGAVIWSRPAADFRERYEISLDPSKYFDESSPAMIRLSKDVSRDVVTSILEKF